MYFTSYPYRAKARTAFGGLPPGRILGYYRDAAVAAEHASAHDYLLEREVSPNNWQKVDPTVLGAQS